MNNESELICLFVLLPCWVKADFLENTLLVEDTLLGPNSGLSVA